MQNAQKSSNSTKKAGKAKRNLKIVVDLYFFFYFFYARRITRARLWQAKVLAALKTTQTFSFLSSLNV